MLKVADIMSPDVFTIPAAAPLGEVAWALAAQGISGAPVRDRKGRLIGTVTKAELIDPERTGGLWRRAAVAGDVMSPRVMVARANDPAIAAVRVMCREGIPQIIVVDEREAVVGIVTPMDVLKALVHGDRFLEEATAEAPPEAVPAWEAEETAC
jgi:CBS-domain-containing membrane protein